MKAHRYFQEAWPLTFAAGADFEERYPKSSGEKRPPAEFFGVNRIAVNREIRALLRYVKSVGGFEQFVVEQADRAVGYRKVPDGVAPSDFVRYRMALLLFIAHQIGAGAAKKRLRVLLGHSGHYGMPSLQSIRRHAVAEIERSEPKVVAVESVEQFLARGGAVRVFSSRAHRRSKPVGTIIGCEVTLPVLVPLAA